MPVAAQINGRLYAIDADYLNTLLRLTNAQGQVVWQWLITGFGEANPTIGATGYAQSGEAGVRSYGEAVQFDLRYPGQVWDEKTWLSYNRHRYYDAGSGRCIQVDPIGLEGGWNRFGYVGGEPLNFADDEGLNRRSAAPSVSYGQSLLNAQGVNLTGQIRQYQFKFSYSYASAPG
ncbi:RHS repeat-associated core domain-containing protein [Paracidovorax anthurii]|uniref:RHS repeat-associated protein n=1 Tax=Paracidovorax anthurii TaxID=78229 RepID=A0A328Y810_9BURK|nr:RHS repeat-associated core domain-containing protein [Paracidovorax anthurii]RAR70168.1 RHS repeat-associated protein [Paracidovorax anthurii]